MAQTVDHLQTRIADIRGQLNGLQTGPGVADAKPNKRVISPEGVAAISKAQKNRWKRQKREDALRAAAESTPKPKPNGIAEYWASMTPKQRKAEMKRRGLVRNLNKQKPAAKSAKPKRNHPSDPNHPDHERYIKALRAGVRKRFKNMPASERKRLYTTHTKGKRGKSDASPAPAPTRDQAHGEVAAA